MNDYEWTHNTPVQLLVSILCGRGAAGQLIWKEDQSSTCQYAGIVHATSIGVATIIMSTFHYRCVAVIGRQARYMGRRQIRSVQGYSIYITIYECRHKESVRTSADHAAGVWQGDGGGTAQGLAGLQCAEDVPILEEPQVKRDASLHWYTHSCCGFKNINIHKKWIICG